MKWNKKDNHKSTVMGKQMQFLLWRLHYCTDVHYNVIIKRIYIMI